MKRFWLMLLCLMLLLSAAQASETFDGVVIAGEPVTVTAPYGGTVETVALRQGQKAQAGETVLTMASTAVVAPEDGTIRGLFAQVGGDAQDTVLYLSPVSKYTVSANVSKAYKSAENRYVTIGESVYLRCSKDNSHVARGVITSVSGSSYTVETTAGELYMEETVYVYRSEDYSSKSCIGSGTVSRTEAVAIGGSGSILKLYVQDGETVERGQRLFETVDGVTGAEVSDAVTLPLSGVVAEVKAQAGQTVNQGDVLLTVYRPEEYQIRFSIPEDMLATVAPGDTAQVYFNWDEDNSSACTGTVTEISYVAAERAEGAETSYDGYLAFTADESVRLGMNVTVVLE